MSATKAAPTRPSESYSSETTIYGVDRHAKVITRLRAMLAAHTRLYGQCVLADGEIAAEAGTTLSHVANAVAYLRTTGELQAVVRTIDEADPRFSGRRLRRRRQGLVYVAPTGRIAQDPGVLAAIETALQERIATVMSRYRETVDAARIERDDAITIARAEAAIARVNARPPTTTTSAA